MSQKLLTALAVSGLTALATNSGYASDQFSQWVMQDPLTLQPMTAQSAPALVVETAPQTSIDEPAKLVITASEELPIRYVSADGSKSALLEPGKPYEIEVLIAPNATRSRQKLSFAGSTLHNALDAEQRN